MAKVIVWSGLVAASMLVGACHREEGRSAPDGVGSNGAGPNTGAGTTTNLPPTPERVDLLGRIDRCEVRHRGVLLDVGSPSIEGLEGWRLTPESGVSKVEHEGATWGKVATRQLHYRFVLDEPKNLFLSARLRGITAKSASITVDGKPLGTLQFTKQQTRTVSTPIWGSPTAAGLHMLGLRFSGSSRDGVDPFAEIDWVRIGAPDDDTSAFAAPTLSDIIHDRVALQKVPHRSIALRAPGVVRCTLGVPPGAKLKTSLGLMGAGEGEAEIRLLVDGQPVEVARSARVLGGDTASWLDVEVGLGSSESRLVTLELAATSATRGARVLFGDPMVVTREIGGARSPRARAVIVVVISSVDAERLPPWAPDKPLPTFDALAREGAVFEAHRAPSTVSGAVMASIVSGLSPRQHCVEDAYARLPESVRTLAHVSKDASIRTAMFTANPSTFEAFGFARGWDKYLARSPISPAMGTAPIDDLISWLGEHAKQADKGLLAVVHTRGIHAPFDIQQADLAHMPPEQYAGPLDPRRAGQVLERLRHKKKLDRVRWAEADATRLSAMIEAATVQTDRSLSNLIDALRKAGLWDDTLLVVTSDVAAAADPSVVPFGEQLDLTEEALRVPLFVRFPGGAHAGVRVRAPSTAVDIAKTALASMGLEVAATAGARDLHELASGGVTAVERPIVSTQVERYVVRWGPYRMAGKDGSPPTLCDRVVDPRCERDLRESNPLAATALFRVAFDHETAATKGRQGKLRREPATLDSDTAAAMAVWGR